MGFYFVHNGVHQSELVTHTYFHKEESGVAAMKPQLHIRHWISMVCAPRLTSHYTKVTTQDLWTVERVVL